MKRDALHFLILSKAIKTFLRFTTLMNMHNGRSHLRFEFIFHLERHDTQIFIIISWRKQD
jgi:hypothetical protein